MKVNTRQKKYEFEKGPNSFDGGAFRGLVCALVLVLVMAALFFGGFMVGRAHGQAKQLNAKWDPNTEPDLAGYRVYWSQESGSYPNSFEIPIGEYSETMNTIPTGWLTPGRWYFAATAYDQTGNESGYSSEVYADVPDVKPGSPKTIQWDLVLPDGTTMHLQVTMP